MCVVRAVVDMSFPIVTVAGISVTDQTLSAVSSESGDLVGGPSDGLMGMAFPALSNLDAVRYPSDFHCITSHSELHHLESLLLDCPQARCGQQRRVRLLPRGQRLRALPRRIRRVQVLGHPRVQHPHFKLGILADRRRESDHQQQDPRVRL